MILKEISKTSIGELVTENFKAASLFKQAGIDFCCGGKMSLEQACAEKNINLDQFISKLNDLSNEPTAPSQNFKEWDLAFLCDYIVNTHHQYVLKTLPQLVAYTQKIASVHGQHHPELIEISDLFGKINTELLQHLKNEEEVLFPAIKEALKSNSKSAKETIVSEINRMTGEHEFAGGAMDEINKLSNSYLLPIDACNTYNVAYKLLEQFEDDLHIHIHLENNILYPKALTLTN
jgi:regulator of cell morphogenesis and NO signaling